MALYDKACGSEHGWFSAWEISKKLGLSEQEVNTLVDRLIKKGLVSLRAFDGLIGISHKGIVAVERERSCS
jgi:helix-turn-helix protein